MLLSYKIKLNPQKLDNVTKMVKLETTHAWVGLSKINQSFINIKDRNHWIIDRMIQGVFIHAINITIINFLYIEKQIWYSGNNANYH